MRPQRFLIRAVLTLLPVTWMCSAQAEESPFIFGHRPTAPASVTDGTPWTEDTHTRLPTLPADADLIAVQLDGTPDAFDYFIDGRQLQIGPDQVVRYTLLARSASGARNLSFEGIRCTLKGQYRVYAYGSESGFIPVDEDWHSIDASPERYRVELWQHHLCTPRSITPRPLADIKRSLSGHSVSRHHSGFLFN